jgi:hypothetical protein
MSNRKKRPSWARASASKGLPNGAASAERRRWRVRIATIVGLLAIAMTVVTVVVALARQREGQPAAPRAAILDQLAATDPNPSLVNSTERSLTQAGYRVDYYDPARIGVDLYRQLPTLGYKIIIVRSHSTGVTGSVDDATGAVHPSGSLISLFTNEPYQTDQHIAEQRDRTLDVVRIAQAIPGVTADPGATVLVAPHAQKYFGITSAFIADHTAGHFDGTIVLLMGCQALSTPDLATAFRLKGAAAVIGWNGPVTAEHTDQATDSVLRELLANGLDAKAAVDTTMSHSGRDPAYGASLVSG